MHLKKRIVVACQKALKPVGLFLKGKTLPEKAKTYLQTHPKEAAAVVLTLVFVFLLLSGGVTGAPFSKTNTLDPLTLLLSIKENKKTYLPVDLRSHDEYTLSHIKGAVSVEEYRPEGLNEIVFVPEKEVKTTLLKKLKGKKSRVIVLYGLNNSLTRLQKWGSFLKGKGYKALVLEIGWEEWINGFNNWLPSAMWPNFSMSIYLESRP